MAILLRTSPPILLLLLVICLFAETAEPKKPLVHHPSWTPALEQNFGITKQQFTEMGLGALTTDQYLNVLFWVSDQEKRAKDSVPTNLFSCGRIGSMDQDTRPEAYDTARVYVTASGDANEIISGVRQRLRSMNGTQVVYASDEADLVISLVAMTTKEKSAQYQLGVAISVVVSQPCLWKYGSYSSHYDVIRDQFLQVGSDVQKVVDSIVSSVDTNDLEDQRKINASWKKYVLAPQKK